MIETYWPLFGLRLRTPRLTLRLPTDDDLARLAQFVERGIHDPATMPFYETGEAYAPDGGVRRSGLIGLMSPTALPSGSERTAYRAPQKAS